MPKRNNPGCKCCTPKNCTTQVSINFFDVSGGQRFAYGVPGSLQWTLTGSTTAGGSISLGGTIAVVAKPWTANFVWSGTQLPEGTYSLHITSPPVCNGMRRFDCTFTVNVVCPKTVVTGSCTAAFDILNIIGGFSHDGCGPCETGPMSISASVPGTICTSSPISCFGNTCSVQYTVAVTSYPATATFTGSQENFTTETYSVTYNADGSNNQLAKKNDVLHSLQQPIQICGYCQDISVGLKSLPDGEVEISGRYSGSGSPSDPCLGPHNDYYQLGNVGKMQVENDFSKTEATITVKHVRYNDSTRTVPAPPPYYTYQFACFAGPFGPTGGYTGRPIYGQYACGGCVLPLKWELQANVLGQQVTLKCQNKQDPNYPTQTQEPGFWAANFKKSIPSLTCGTKLDGSDTNWGFGEVDFYIFFQGGVQYGPGIGVGPSMNVYYRAHSSGLPWQCPGGLLTPNGYMGVTRNAQQEGYDLPKVGWSCDPFMAYATGDWIYSAYWKGVNYGPYYYPLNFSISE